MVVFEWLLFNIHTLNTLYAVAGLAIVFCTVLLLWDLCGNQQNIYRRFFAPYIWQLIIVLHLGGVLTTLLYSEVFGFVPCSLCWLQRVALYPQLLLSLLAYKVRDAKLFPLYGLVLSTFGLMVATYHYIYQNLPKDFLQSGALPCLVDGSADCTEKFMEVFGFVTFPFLSATLFAFLIMLYLHWYKSNSDR